MTVPWLPPPDWSEPVEERRRYRTDILAGADGTEQRRQLRLRPRLSLSFRTQLMDAHEAVRLARELEAVGQDWITLPWWADVALVTADVAVGGVAVVADTAGRTFRAGPDAALLYRSSALYRILTVDLVGPTGLTVWPVPEAWPAGSEVVPLVRGRLIEAARIAYVTDASATLSLTIEAEA